MLRVFCLTLVLVVSVAMVPAGNWTPEQKEVLDHIQGCWDAWEKSVAEKNHEFWVRACRPDPELLWWTDGDGVPQDFDAYKRITKWELETQDRVVFTDFRPIHVKIHGDTAVVSNYGYFGWIDKDGERNLMQDKRLTVLQKKEQGWTFIAETVVAVDDLPDWLEKGIED